MSPPVAAHPEVDAPSDGPAMPALRLGTRGSALALAQAHLVAARMLRTCGVASEIVIITTTGDRLSEAAVTDAGGKRVFVKEIEDALLDGTVDLAVHSSKDLSVTLPEGLEIGAVLPREDPRDVLVLPLSRAATGSVDEIAQRLAPAPRIGTGSVRRVAQLSRVFAGGRFLPVRGNLDTRLRKLDDGDYDALVLAAAGLNRLHRAGRVSCAFPVETCVPAPGQGIIAVQVRAGNTRAREAVSTIDDRSAAAALAGERAVVGGLGGGCHMPIGAFADVAGYLVRVTGVVLSADGARTVRAEAAGPTVEATHVGSEVAERLLALGAAEILADAANARPPWGGLP
jgi:hydroxymethylbilane synthase